MHIIMVLDPELVAPYGLFGRMIITVHPIRGKPALVADRREDYLVRGLAKKGPGMCELGRIPFHPASTHVKMQAVLRG